jgi:hypothetical protein
MHGETVKLSPHIYLQLTQTSDAIQYVYKVLCLCYVESVLTSLFTFAWTL